MQDSDLINSISACNQVYTLYRDILNTHTSDFFLEHHWHRLPNCWKDYFEKLTLEELGTFLKGHTTTEIAPLSMICLQKVLTSHVLPRQPVKLPEIYQLDQKFTKEFWRGVKLKKRHEISVMAQICYETALNIGCFNIVDVGSGLGHLSRMLCYGYGFKVCTFEADKALSKSAELLDKKFEQVLLGRSIKHRKTVSTVHINKRIEESIVPTAFLNLVSQSFGIDTSNLKFCIVGLHPCGNLGTTLLRLFNQCPNVTLINVVGCCYMKLSTEPSLYQGFPLSEFCKSRQFFLDYLSCELACHALEVYIERLESNDLCHLKVHALRAALESVLVKFDPFLRHSQIANVKYKEGLTFFDYCKSATKNMTNYKLCLPDIEYFEKVVDKTWLNVVKFYCIRLTMASSVESIILYDRLLYVQESGNSKCKIIPLFDCNISPRNHVLSATKY